MYKESNVSNELYLFKNGTVEDVDIWDIVKSHSEYEPLLKTETGAKPLVTVTKNKLDHQLPFDMPFDKNMGITIDIMNVDTGKYTRFYLTWTDFCILSREICTVIPNTVYSKKSHKIGEVGAVINNNIEYYNLSISRINDNGVIVLYDKNKYITAMIRFDRPRLIELQTIFNEYKDPNRSDSIII